MRAAITLLAAGAAIVTTACRVSVIERELPVGRLHRTFTDTTRVAWSGQGPRPISATVWYPAALESVETDWTIGVFRFGLNALDAAFVDRTARPLIVLSHGTGGSAAQLSWLAEDLATRGYVVAGVSHHGNTAAEERTWPAGFVLPWERARDLSVLIDRLLADSVLGPHIDTTRIGAAGFSLGGYSVLALGGARIDFADWRARCASAPSALGCALPPEADFTLADVDSLAQHDAPFRASVERAGQPTTDGRVRAVYAMAPALLPMLDTTSLAAMSVPLRVVLGGADTQVPAAEADEIVRQFARGASIDTRADVPHYAFLAPCTLRGRLLVRPICATAGVTRVKLHTSVAKDAVRFFDTALRAATPTSAFAP